MNENAIRALAHEIGHALTNRADTFFTRYRFFPGTRAVPDTTVESRRRILHATENDARTTRDPLCLTCAGNLLLAP